MIVNPKMFQAILLNKCYSTHTKETMNIGNKKIKSLSSAKLLGIKIDNKLNFNNHIKYTIWRSAANQLITIIRLRRFLEMEKRKLLIFRITAHQYCYYLGSLHKKLKNLQKLALRFMLPYYESSYDKLLRLSHFSAINDRFKRDLCIEIGTCSKINC